MRQVIPLKQRPVDIVIVAFFVINLFFVTYIVDVEQLIIADPRHFTYPLWPPPALVDLVHWWGDHFDPLQNARPMWWKATIWLDSLLFGPFYAAAIYAFVKGKDWIRNFALVWAGIMFANVSIILSEEAQGLYATPAWGVVLSANLPWLLLPIVVAARLWKTEHPFTRAPESQPT